MVSAGDSSVTASVPTDGALDAAEAIGWDAELYDGQLVPATYPGLVRQAIAAQADGILLVAIDCQAVKQPLEEARAAGIVVIGIGTFDCDDPHGGGDARGLFTTRLNYGPRGKDLGRLVASYGTDQANYIIAASDNQAKIIVVSDPEFTTLYYTDRGFEKTIERSGGAEIVSTLEVTTADFVNNQLVPKIQAELLRHPEADWIKSPYTYATTLGIVPALGSHAGIDRRDGRRGPRSRARPAARRQDHRGEHLLLGVAGVGRDRHDEQRRSARPSPSTAALGWVMADERAQRAGVGAVRAAVDYRVAVPRGLGRRLTGSAERGRTAG